MKKYQAVIWISGYSASGKTVVGRKLESKLRLDGLKTIFLDGDDLRSIFGNKWGYERKDRIELGKVYFRLCSHLASQGLTVIISAVAMYDEIREWLKANVSNSFEIFLDTPLNERLARDARTKRIYSQYVDSNLLYDEPKNPDLVIKNCDDINPDDAAETIKMYFYQSMLNNPSCQPNINHWDFYYKTDQAPVEPSSFATLVAKRISPNQCMLEVGCGNGRDSVYFHHLGHSVTALDTCRTAISLCVEKYQNIPIRFIAGSASVLLEKELACYSVIYSRFSLHAMTQTQQEEFFSASKRLLVMGGTIQIECRSINDPLARKGEVISPTERIYGHYRRFIVLDELVRQISFYGFEVLEAIESDDLAKYKDDDPIVIRLLARRNSN